MAATPKGQTQSRAEQYEQLAEITELSPDYQLPEIGELGFLVDYLSEIGEARFSGESITPIDWVDIHAWSVMTGTALSTGESLALRRLSHAYVDQCHKSKESSCVAPCFDAEKARVTVAHKLESFFAMLRSNKK